MFEKLGMSLYDFLKAHDYAAYPLGHVREFARQLLETLDFLKNTMRLVHTDLKPENILLCSNDTETRDGREVPASTQVKGACGKHVWRPREGMAGRPAASTHPCSPDGSWLGMTCARVCGQ